MLPYPDRVEQIGQVRAEEVGDGIGQRPQVAAPASLPVQGTATELHCQLEQPGPAVGALELGVLAGGVEHLQLRRDLVRLRAEERTVSVNLIVVASIIARLAKFDGILMLTTPLLKLAIFQSQKSGCKTQLNFNFGHASYSLLVGSSIALDKKGEHIHTPKTICERVVDATTIRQ